MTEEATEYNELEQTQDQLTISNFMALKNQNRALMAEMQLVQQALQSQQGAAEAAQKRLEEHAKAQQAVAPKNLN